MKTTLDIPDDLFRRAAAKAALEGMKLKDLVTEGLRLRLEVERTPQHRSTKRRPLLKNLDALPLLRSRRAGARKLKVTPAQMHELELAAEVERNAASLR